MINRELIRIKTVQLLYSYLLVEHPFSLESQPSAPTKEKRFAYSLYLDLLYLMVRLASDVDEGKGNPLAGTRFIEKVRTDSLMKGVAGKYEAGHRPFESLEPALVQAIRESAIYKRFLKGDGDVSEDNVWKQIFDYIILMDSEVNAEIAARENYTLKGVDRMRNIMDETFTNFFASADNLPDALKVLRMSLDKTREFYFRLLALPMVLTELRRREIDNARYKLLKTEDDINPNLRFVENGYVQMLEEDESLHEKLREFGVNWIGEDEGLIKNLLHKIMESNIYAEYMDFPATDFATDCEFWRNVYKFVIFIDQDFLEYLEDKSVFWNDDIDVIGSFILKEIKRLRMKGSPSGSVVLPMFKDDEDARFGAELFEAVIRRKDWYRSLIVEGVDRSQWEAERLAFMDVVIIMTALAEIVNFPKIPLNVSFNEYIEIAKFYSTPRSGMFINGFLGRIVHRLQEEGKILKKFEQK